jgi:hypothetical protein
MRLRLVAPRRDDGARVDMTTCTAPALVGLRCVLGVGDPDGEPSFVPVYQVALPVAQPGALDDDDVHEFAAADLLADVQRRAVRRAWALRVEVDVEQTAGDVGCEVYASGPDEVVLNLLREAALPGGGRRLTLGTGLAHTPEAAVRLAGAYVVQHGAEAGASVGFKLGLTEYEFEV